MSACVKYVWTSRCVVALITTVLGAASAWRRAATFGVSPRAKCSWRPPPLISPTTTRPVWMPSRTASWTPCSRTSRALSEVIAEVDQQAIAQILGDVAVKALDHLGTRGLIRQDHVAQLFRIQLAGQRRRVDQIAEQHRELAALRCRFIPCHTRSRSLRRVGGLALRLRWFGRCG